MCPQETDLQGNPTQPRSYTSAEPAMLRALRYDFNTREQFWDRIPVFFQRMRKYEINEEYSAKRGSESSKGIHFSDFI
mgnify:CR=1 FL=1